MFHSLRVIPERAFGKAGQFALLVTSFVGIMCFSRIALSAVNVEETAAQSESRDRAKLRIYPGGRDEQDLKVQSTLTSSGRYPEGAGASGQSPAAAPGGGVGDSIVE